MDLGRIADLAEEVYCGAIAGGAELDGPMLRLGVELAKRWLAEGRIGPAAADRERISGSGPGEPAPLQLPAGRKKAKRHECAGCGKVTWLKERKSAAPYRCRGCGPAPRSALHGAGHVPASAPRRFGGPAPGVVKGVAGAATGPPAPAKGAAEAPVKAVEWHCPVCGRVSFWRGDGPRACPKCDGAVRR